MSLAASDMAAPYRIAGPIAPPQREKQILWLQGDDPQVITEPVYHRLERFHIPGAGLC